MLRRTEQPCRQPVSPPLFAIAALLWTSTITGCWSASLRAARSPGMTTPHFVTSNRLGESNGRGPSSSLPGTRRALQGDYNSLLEMVNGDFGVKSAAVNAAESEPEYKGSATLVVPLYIPEGAVPIRLARIARSGAAFAKALHSSPPQPEAAPSRVSARRGIRVPPSVTSRRQGGPRRSASIPTSPPSYLRGWGRRIAPRADSRVGLHDDSEPSASDTLQTSGQEVIRRKKNQNSRITHFQEEEEDVVDGNIDLSSQVSSRARSTATTATPTSTTESTTAETLSTSSIKIPVEVIEVHQDNASLLWTTKAPHLSNSTLRIPVVSLRSSTALPLQTSTTEKSISTVEADDREPDLRPVKSSRNGDRRPMPLPRPAQDILGHSSRISRTTITTTPTASATTSSATTVTPPVAEEDDVLEDTASQSKSVRTGSRIPLLLRSRTSQSLRTTEEPPISEVFDHNLDLFQPLKPSNHIVNTRRLPFPPRPSHNSSPSSSEGEADSDKEPVDGSNDQTFKFRQPSNNRKSLTGSDVVTISISPGVTKSNSPSTVTEDSILSMAEKSTSVVTPSSALSVSIPVRRRRPLRTRLTYVETSPKSEPNFSALSTKPTTVIPITSATTEKLLDNRQSTTSTTASSSAALTTTTTTTTSSTTTSTTTSTTPAPESTVSPSTTTTSTVRRIHEFFKISPYRNVQKTTASTEIEETKPTTKYGGKTSTTTPASLLYPTSQFWHKNSQGPKFTSTQKSPNVSTPTRKISESPTPSRKLPNQATTPIPAAKSPADIVLDSLSEVMRDATSGDKDRYREIATDLDILNKQLAERGILIIHAEIDGKIIKLRNQTKGLSYDGSLAGGIDKRPSYVKGSDNFNESELESVLSQSLSSTDDSITTIFTPSDKLEYDLVLKNDDDLLGSNDAELSSTYYSVRNNEDLADQVNGIARGKVVRVPSLTTQKATTITERVHSPSATNATLPEISIENIRNSGSSILRTRKVQRIPVERVNSSLVSTRLSAFDSENDAVDNISDISASTSYANPVTTRTRTTLVPVTETFGLETAPLNDLVMDAAGISKPISTANSQEKDKDARTTVVLPSSHVRPIMGNVPAEVILEPSPSRGNDLKGSKQQPPSSGVPQNTNTGDRSREDDILVIEEFLIEQNAAGDLSASSSNNHDENPSSTPDDDSGGASSVYLVGMVGIFPLAGVAAFIVRRFLRGEAQQKALPESEERPDGFTPPTHHHPRPHSLLPDVPEPKLSSPPSSETGPTPSVPTPTPWEFSRSKLRFVSVLGEGNFGVVWKAEARGFGDFAAGEVLVAVKMVKDNAGAKEKCDLLRELSVMQQLGPHQNVVSLLGCCTQTEPHLVIMEYIMFGKLLTFLRDHRLRHNYFNFSSDTAALTSRDLTRFACQVAHGCDYLQSRGIIHRDLAARNILVDHNKLCKIADFGMARSLQDIDSEIYEQKSKGAQPVRWMAPESLCLSIFTHKSDVWSFGILCWEIVTLGATPYPGLSAREVMCQVTKGYRLERPEHCRPELYRLLAKCWQYDVNKRPSFHQLNMELNTLLEHHTGYIDLENFPEEDYFSMHQNNDEKL